jgi:hypothetical protein
MHLGDTPPRPQVVCRVIIINVSYVGNGFDNGGCECDPLMTSPTHRETRRDLERAFTMPSLRELYENFHIDIQAFDMFLLYILIGHIDHTHAFIGLMQSLFNYK